ncbi:hypothetical protein [Micromonospora sp. NBC_01813]|uniref:hypothetical protein n=1 Tax=Micromonospora sp. NBC_01813 TaxID=2975988 RepID=UPI002DDAA158|nr:hypothetical protein [Micromonospora sp. NBC_01813]WSA11881.1 hypothetical protein OG958_14500 [Micromonospora sp. NBC_01813]
MDDVDAPQIGADHAAWHARPPAVLGQVVAGQLLLARSDRAAVVLTSVLAYPSGFEFDISAILREPQPAGVDAFVAGAAVPRPRSFVETDGGPELTVRFADGTTLSSARPGPLPEHPGDGEGVPAGPVLVPVAASTDDRRHDARFWIWSLPPEGPVVIECGWPAQEITYGRVEISGTLIRQAAAGAVELWPQEAAAR